MALDNCHFVEKLSFDFLGLVEKLRSRSNIIGIVGLGYVGIPLALIAIRAGFRVVGFDIDAPRVAMINRGESFIKHIPPQAIQDAVGTGRFTATTDMATIAGADAVIICVPTPLTRHREPDLSFVEETTRAIAKHLRHGHLIVLASTTYPGTTTGVVRPILEAGGLQSGKDFLLAFSPEREDPGNPDFSMEHIPKVIGGDGPHALSAAETLYSQLVVRTVPVSSPDTAEAVKLTENIFRSVNIALVNELKAIYGAMGIDIWEVIEAAKTKPFGFMPFYPGPGLGGHCIPIDPFYLAWKAREHDVATRFIELAGEINTRMPYRVVNAMAEALNQSSARGLKNARVLLLGVAYKKNVDDMRESPSLKLMELLEARGAQVNFHDPFVPVIPRTREHPAFAGRHSLPLTEETIRSHDALLIATDHDTVDYQLVVDHAILVVDTRNACSRARASRKNIVKA